jgi:cell division protein FtsQ
VIRPEHERAANRASTPRPVRENAPVLHWWLRWRRRLVLLAMGVVTALVLAAYFTPLLGVWSVQVRGNRTLTEQEVLTAGEVQLGKPMLQVNTDEIQSRLRTVPKVSSARVELVWPSTVRLDVTEREPVVFMVASNGIQLVDSTGVPFSAVPQPPRDLPELRVRTAAPDDPATRAAMTVLSSLPPTVRPDVTAVIAETSRDVHLLLKGNRQVHWGDPDDSARKAAILPPLLTRPGKVYDVTSPVLPTVA